MCCAALARIISPLYPKVRSGLSPSKDAGWTRQQYTDAVRNILAAPANAVPAAALEHALGEGAAGRQALQAMVRADLLVYRPQSRWAQDIDESAFPYYGMVVTAPTPAHVACMRRLKSA